MSYNARVKCWETKVFPGFVNGIDPTCPGYLSTDQVRIIKKYDLTDEPWIPINSWRDVDGQMGSIPQYFAMRGVRKDSNYSINSDMQTVVENVTQPDPSLPKRRYLKSADIWVEMARATYSMNITTPGNIFTGEILNYDVTFNSMSLNVLGDRPRLEIGAMMPPKSVPTIEERLNGSYQDDGIDRCLVGTVFLLSPVESPDADLSTWTPYAQVRCGWNLMHAAKNRAPVNTVQSPTTAFIAIYAATSVLVVPPNGLLDAELQRIMAAVLNDTSNDGRFWSI